MATDVYDSVLVPTDGSAPSLEAAEHAVDIASRYDAVIHALFVVDQTGPGSHWDMVVEEQEAEGEQAVEAVEALAEEAGLVVEKHFRRGRPHEEVVDAARDYGVDLVVMGTEGRTGFERLATPGSTTERVVRLTTVPVLVVGGAGDGEPASSRRSGEP